MTMEVFLVALTLAFADEPMPAPDRSVVEEAQQFNTELEELLDHLRSLPAPVEETVDAPEATNPATVIAEASPPVEPEP